MLDIQPIGVIHSPHTSIEDMPIQPKGAVEVIGHILIDEEYVDGLKDLEGFSHIYLLYHFHKATRVETEVVPFMDTQKRGVFSTRSPLRPNHIGLSIVNVIGVKGRKIFVKGIDVLDETPLLDIKPYIAPFDAVRESTTGWMEGSEEDVRNKRSDDRFG
ncbi:MAG TPA: tRNA (N6-threonylcarbamoyladenosine(37)-N6)-methyltransferase TrmO [Myxococcales bacterium]|nr:tRNA (N6-threonylcarbamoyladenosine(37)-N6)-methyltransferase TrmO [Deltaproteobacteria bacterium]MBU50705.1 tRNA (N6-threonylcarbamoyladenosine(37)-N6)-methyltransferase TrmO [Deltaproteobacteria bacterium]HAA53421.1 tRNA (N6-threonylcarbamoyladenosine(37)-N6)-methyltransferase TrmO [Myxococcales bacterium]|tara:strand:+ start:62336 stop:62812 length:477 start_codon:yes stop_codon:yes gene_type:complete